MVYSQEAEDNALSFFQLETASIYNKITDMSADTTKEAWKQLLEDIAREFRFSSRFALMRIFQARGHRCSILADDNWEQEGFSLTAGENTYAFSPASPELAGNISEEISGQYINLMMDMASDHQALKGKREIKKADALIRAAWFNADDRQKMMLTRQDAILLGHTLNFSIDEMQFFLVRVFDTVGGNFRINRSEDLIDYYGFLCRATPSRVQTLKDSYYSKAKDISKDDSLERNTGWTLELTSQLMNQFDKWNAQPQTMDDQFLDWIVGRASGLDLYSQTACRVFRNLAAFAYNLENGKSFISDSDEFCDKIYEICSKQEESMAAKLLFRENGILSTEKCKEVADTLLKANNERSGSLIKARANAWHIPKLDMHGELTQSGVVNSDPERLLDLLTGKEEVEKADMLLLFWFTANVTWQYDADSVSAEALFGRLVNYIDLSNELLQSALLPEFYIPHILERSMLLSIVLGAGSEDTSAIYVNMLLSLVKERSKETDSPAEKRSFEKHDESFKIMVINDYRTHPEMTLAECARKYGVSDQSISLWQKKFLAQGKVK